jgi:superfamily I DNA/RNA helicase
MADIYDLSKEKKLRWNSPYKDYGSISELKYEAGLRGDIETTRAVALLEKLGTDQFNSAIASLRAAPNRPSAMVHVLTSHKAKGMEWPHVKICDEFRTVFFNRKGYLKKEIQEEELNLLYVSVTRAQLTVSIPDAISEILNHKTKPAEDRVYEECAERSL